MKELIYAILIIISVSSIYAIDITPITNEGGDAGVFSTSFYFAECTESWSCTSWSSCLGSTQTRSCTDSNYCGTQISKPSETQSCSSGTGTNTGGSGSGGSSISQCPEGQILETCRCQSITRTSGYCINNIYYETNQNYEPPKTNSTTIVSNTTKAYYFTINSDQFSYKEGENFEMSVKVYKDDALVDATDVYFDIYFHEKYIGTYHLRKESLGKYYIMFDNNLDLGTYNLNFHVDISDIKLLQDKTLKIEKNPELTNIIYTPSGQFSIIITIILISGIIIIVLIIMFYWEIHKWRKKKS